MRKKTKYKKIPYTVFVAKDGKEFEDENKCLIHEKILDGKAKLCPKCNGNGYTIEEIEYDNYHTGSPMYIDEKCFCKMCQGKGYLEKVEVWK